MSAMDSDGDEKDDTKRKVRNLSEKKRRDQFNTLVNELSSMVSTNARKMDKSSILKSTIAYLKNHNETTMRSRAHEVQADWKPAFLINEEFTYLLIEALEGFVMVLSSSGTIHYVSESVLSLLGHNPADMINKNIFDLTYEEDRPHMFSILQNNGNVLDILSQSAKDQAIRFECHIRRGGEAVYELVQISGHFRNNSEHVENSNFDNGGHTEQDSASSVLFVCTGRLKSPKLIRDVSLVDTDRNEFTSRHSLEWKFLFLDHRAPPIIGYLPFEVLGTSGYDYYHIDDLEKINSCHEDLMQKGELTSCCYRFLTKGQQWIWLQTRFYITYHQWNSKPEFVVCTHRVVNCLEESKGMKQEDATNGAAETVPGASCNPAEEPATVPLPTLSPSYMSDVSDAFSTYQPSRPSSVKSMSASSTVGSTISMDTHSTLAANNTLHTGWRANRTPSQRYSNMSDTATSVSGDSRSSHRSTIETPVLPSADSQSQRANAVQHFGHMHITQKADDICMVPQHGMGAQYLQPMPYVSAVVPIQVPVIVTTDAVQIQTRSDSQVNDSQLQRKHEQLQLMMLRQQEELRQVKEQLLLARLGMLQPLNLQTTYMTLEEMQQTTLALQQAQAAFEQPPPRPAIMEVPHQPDQLSDNPHMAQ